LSLKSGPSFYSGENHPFSTPFENKFFETLPSF
jgi:hypothetical protein